MKYRKKGIKVDLETEDFTASGVFDRTNMNYVRQYIAGTCHNFHPHGNVIPDTSQSTLIATGDDALRAVHEDSA